MTFEVNFWWGGYTLSINSLENDKLESSHQGLSNDILHDIVLRYDGCNYP